MAMGSGNAAPEPVRPAAPFLLRSAPVPDVPRLRRLKPHQAIARWMCGQARHAATTGTGAIFDRVQIAAALDFKLVRVKRSLALLSLSGVLECNADKVTVRDWARLCDVARIELAELGIRPVEHTEAEAILILETVRDDAVPDPVRTAAGEPACFV